MQNWALHSMALDFMIASDIINSTVHTELKDLYELGIIVLLRTAIGYFLGKEIQEIEESTPTEPG